MDNKKQHTVPACYLENFTDENGRVFVRRENHVYASKPENVLTGNLFYTVPLEEGGASNFFEQALCNLEGNFAELYRQKLGPRLDFDQTDRELLSTFIAAMMLRTKAFRASLSRTLDEIHEHVEEVMVHVRAGHKVSVPSASTPGAESYPIDELLRYRDDLPSFQAGFFFGQIEQAANIIHSMQWRIWTATEPTFVTSDSPVNWANLELREKYGYDGMRNLYWLCHPGAELSMALSKDLAWSAGWKMSADLEYLPASKSASQELNERSIRGAHEEVLGSDQSYLEGLTFGDIKDRPP